MKKILSMILVLMLMLCTLATAEATDLSGEWYLLKMVFEGEEYDVGMLGLEMVMTLNPDGSASMDDEEGGTWTATDTGIVITFDDTDEVMELIDDQLVLEEDGDQMVFGREKAESLDVGEERTDAVLDDFNGSWKAVYVKSDESFISADTIGMTGTLVIENGNATQTLGVEESAVEQPLTGEFADGVLTLTGVDGSQTAKLYTSGMLTVEEAEYTIFYQIAE